MKQAFVCFLFFSLALPISVPSLAQLPKAQQEKKRRKIYISTKNNWYRNLGEWIASISVRDNLMVEPNTKIITDGKRYDVNLGKRISLLHSRHRRIHKTGWSFGISAAMVAMLRLQDERWPDDSLIISTENFEGLFGAYLGMISHSWLLLTQVGHVSSHLVDNNPNVFNAITYSRFWIDFTIGRQFPSMKKNHRFRLYIQNTIGYNFKSKPEKKGLRLLSGLDISFRLGNSRSPSLMASMDFRNPGIQDQKAHYSAFVGFGHPKYFNLKHRPWRLGVSYLWKGDYRNQYHKRTDEYLALTCQLEL